MSAVLKQSQVQETEQPRPHPSTLVSVYDFMSRKSRGQKVSVRVLPPLFALFAVVAHSAQHHCAPHLCETIAPSSFTRIVPTGRANQNLP